MDFATIFQLWRAQPEPKPTRVDVAPDVMAQVIDSLSGLREPVGTVAEGLQGKALGMDWYTDSRLPSGEWRFS